MQSTYFVHNGKCEEPPHTQSKDLNLECGWVQERDSSDEEWELEFKRPIEHQNLELDLQIYIRAMVEDVFQQVDEPMALKDRTMEIVKEVFVVLDGLQEEANVGNASNSEDELFGVDHEPLREVASKDAMPQDNNFDLVVLEEAIKELYRGSKCTKLVVTILFMNLCMVHGVNNKFANELNFHSLMTIYYLQMTTYPKTIMLLKH